MGTVAIERRAHRVLDALGDPTRRAIFQRVCRKTATVSELAVATSVTLAAIGQHLGVLEACDLVQTRKVGRVRHCTASPGGLAVLQEWISLHQSLWARRLDTLEDILAEGAES